MITRKFEGYSAKLPQTQSYPAVDCGFNILNLSGSYANVHLEGITRRSDR
jgi:hypothetical protein